jgi:hypothetical protein
LVGSAASAVAGRQTARFRSTLRCSTPVRVVVLAVDRGPVEAGAAGHVVGTAVARVERVVARPTLDEVGAEPPASSEPRTAL